MTDAARQRERAYLDLLHFGLVWVRDLAYEGQVELCLIEADHLHNIPSLVGETNEHRHVYYIVEERGLYLNRLRELGATERLQQSSTFYSGPWRVLARAAGVKLSECGLSPKTKRKSRQQMRRSLRAK